MVGAMERVRVASGRRDERLAFRKCETRLLRPGNSPCCFASTRLFRGSWVLREVQPLLSERYNQRSRAQ